MTETNRLRPESLAVVLYAYNERGNLLRLLSRIRAVLARELPECRVRYAICVQGQDGTLDEVRRFEESLRGDPRSRLASFHSAAPMGVRGACLQAFALVDGQPDAYLMMDCDCNHQPEELPRFLPHLCRGRVVIGSRFCAGGRIVGMPAWKHFLSVVFNVFSSVVLRVPVRDKTSGYRLIAGADAPRIAARVIGRGFDFYIEFLLRLHAAGYSMVEVPIEFRVRTAGVSKMRIGRTLIDYLGLLRRMLSGKLK